MNIEYKGLEATRQMFLRGLLVRVSMGVIIVTTSTAKTPLKTGGKEESFEIKCRYRVQKIQIYVNFRKRSQRTRIGLGDSRHFPKIGVPISRDQNFIRLEKDRALHQLSKAC